MSRQYSPDEVSAILKEAAEETRKRPGSAHGDGLTLAELQAIGAESDIDAGAIQRAAARLDALSLEPAKRRMLGINVGASHAIRLQRPVTDAEFESLVADCRRTFDARGKVSEQPNYREWRNGNLRVWTEQDPHSGAALLSMQSTQGLMRTMIMGGGISLGWALVLAIMSIFESGGDAIAMSVTLAFVGVALMATAAVATRSWSNTREEQMEEIGERAVGRQAAAAGVTAESESPHRQEVPYESDIGDRSETVVPSERRERELIDTPEDAQAPSPSKETGRNRSRQR